MRILARLCSVGTCPCSALEWPFTSADCILQDLQHAVGTPPSDGLPALWEANWRQQGGPNPAQLWDPAVLVPNANFTVGSTRQLCSMLTGQGARDIAVVGNGPLSDDQRAASNAADRVVRFNAVNNRYVAVLSRASLAIAWSLAACQLDQHGCLAGNHC